MDAGLLAVDEDRASRGLQEPREDLDERGFAAPVRAEQTDDLAGGELEGDVCERGRRTVALRQAVARDCRHGEGLSAGQGSGLLRGLGRRPGTEGDLSLGHGRLRRFFRFGGDLCCRFCGDRLFRLGGDLCRDVLSGQRGLFGLFARLGMKKSGFQNRMSFLGCLLMPL